MSTVDYNVSDRSLSGFKGAVTRQLNNAEKSATALVPNVPSLDADINLLISRWAKYESKFTEYLQERELDLDDNDYNLISGTFADFENAYNDKLRNYRAILVGMSGQRGSVVNNNNNIKVRMPELRLYEFHGELDKFQIFWDKFNALVHKRTDLEKVVKMTYLMDCLKGPALATVAGYHESEEDYDDAIAALLAKYDDREKTKQTLTLQLFNLRNPENTFKDLEIFKAEYERILKSLKHYVPNLNASNWLIEILLQSKLPADADRFIYQRYNTKYFSIEQISQGLTDHSDYLIKLSKSNKNIYKLDSVPKNQVGTYVVSTKSKFSNSNCLLCDSVEHRAKACTDYVDLKSRREKLKDMNRCTWCLGIHKGKCSNKIKCNICQKTNHNEIFCFRNFKFPNKVDNTNQGEGKLNAVIACTASRNIRKSVALPTAIVNVFENGSNDFISTRCLFDSGSQMSFITSNLVKKLNLKTADTISLKIQGFKSKAFLESYPVVNVVVALGTRKKRVKLAVVDSLPSNFTTPGLNKACNLLKYNNVKVSDNFDSDLVSNIGILMGSEYFGKFVGNLTQFNGITLFETPGGLMIFGEIPSNFYKSCDFGEPSALICRITTSYMPNDIPDLVEEYVEPVSKLWELESIGINTNEVDNEDKFAYDSYLDSVKFEHGRYWVRLPFKPNFSGLPTNYKQALGQLYSLRSNLSRNPDYLNCYNNIINEQISRKFIEVVPDAKVFPGTHYLPHHGVAKDSITTPLRIVFNASSRATKDSPSLNDLLMKGPSMTENLTSMLLKFRLNKFAFTADIEKAFLNIGLQIEDRDKVRFLWFKEPNNPQSEVITYRFASVLFGATSSPFLLQATLDFHLRRLKSNLRDKLLNAFYVDNFQGSTNEEFELFGIYKEANTHLASAHMPLRMWATNNLNLKTRIEADFQDYKVPTSNNVLGLVWYLETDQLGLKSVKLTTPQVLNKRKLLGLISTVFDPLGLVVPVLIRGKLLVQSAWRCQVSWDDTLPDCFLQQWKILYEDFVLLSNVRFPRIVALEGSEYILHLFCDSSQIAYGCVLYLTTNSSSTLLFAKAKVAPIKTKTLPQLELTAVWLGTKVAKYVVSNFNSITFSDVIVWSDSEVCLQWIRNNNSNLTYVKNRVAEIREISSNYKFYHVVSNQNPADLLTRGMSYNDFIKSDLWFSGPGWLTDRDCWPNQKETIFVNEIVAEPEPMIVELIKFFDIEKFSNLNKIYNITKYVFKFIGIFRTEILLPEVSVFWFIYSQIKYFRDIFSFLYFRIENYEFPFNCFRGILCKPINISKDLKFMIEDLGLYLDKTCGLIRSRGRLHNSELTFNAKYPILISSKCWLTRLIVMKAHIYCLHGGVQDTLATVRQQVWIPKGRQTVKKLISNCILCRKVEGKPCIYPGPPPLPSVRVTLNRPFERVGVDYSGAIFLTKTSDNTPIKVYICLFTCTATRAVYLSVAQDMSAETFLLILRKFCATHSIPKIIISDNGTNFVASAKFLEEIHEHLDVSNYCINNKILWKFIAPRAPWQGGFYEIMIKLVKNCLRKVLFKKKVTLVELETILVEIQARVNNRPLTYINSDRDNLEILTPSHLLTGRRVNLFPSLVDDNISDPSYLTNTDLNSHYRHLSLILNKFTDVWKKEYLLSLREKHYGSCPAKVKTFLNIGQVVLIESDSSRGDWPLGKITDLHYDMDNVVRSVEVYTDGKTLIKTIEKLIPLEISESVEFDGLSNDGLSNNNSHNKNNNVGCESDNKFSDLSTRPKRLAGVKAAENRQLLIADGKL